MSSKRSEFDLAIRWNRLRAFCQQFRITRPAVVHRIDQPALPLRPSCSGQASAVLFGFHNYGRFGHPAGNSVSGHEPPSGSRHSQRHLGEQCPTLDHFSSEPAIFGRKDSVETTAQDPERSSCCFEGPAVRLRIDTFCQTADNGKSFRCQLFTKQTSQRSGFTCRACCADDGDRVAVFDCQLPLDSQDDRPIRRVPQVGRIIRMPPVNQPYVAGRE